MLDALLNGKLSSTQENMEDVLTSCVFGAFWSGKSAHADSSTGHPTDQLAKEWDHLVTDVSDSCSRPLLVYVTSDAIYPQSDIECARKEYDQKRSGTDGYVPFQCYWVSWRLLYRILDKVDCAIGRDVRRLAQKFGFQEFDGFTIEQVAMNWRFNLGYVWGLAEVQDTEWRYGR